MINSSEIMDSSGIYAHEPKIRELIWYCKSNTEHVWQLS